MEPKVRGLVESLIDDLITEKGLTSAIGIMKLFQPVIKSEEDAVFGYIAGIAHSNFIANYKIMFKKIPDRKADTSFINMMQRRAIDIKSKIREMVNL